MNKKINRMFLVLFMIAGMMVFAACSGAAPEEMNEKSQQPSEEEMPKTSLETNESASSVEESADALLSDPQKIKFSTSDGVELNGIYYPSKSISAPLVILMHWVPGDQDDWVEIAYWLQNRGMGGNNASTANMPWLDSSWFPDFETGKSYNVFSFTFRNCENGCKSFQRDKWYVDVQTAVDYAYQLDSIDNSNIVMMGASIGSDGAADGCAYLNRNHPGVCKGALSFSPGNYLTINFGEMVKDLGEASDPVPVWCFYAEDDPESAGVCGNITEDNYTPYPYPSEMIFSNGHGMNLIAPNHDPDPLEKILEFLEMVL